MPSSYPTYVPKDLVGDYLESYASSQSLTVLCGATVKRGGAVYSTDDREWTVEITVNGVPGILKAAHFVIATGIRYERGPFFEIYILLLH